MFLCVWLFLLCCDLIIKSVSTTSTSNTFGGLLQSFSKAQTYLSYYQSLSRIPIDNNHNSVYNKDLRKRAKAG